MSLYTEFINTKFVTTLFKKLIDVREKRKQEINEVAKIFGDPEELLSTILWLCDDRSAFVTGIVVPVDGGFSAFAGV